MDHVFTLVGAPRMQADRRAGRTADGSIVFTWAGKNGFRLLWLHSWHACISGACLRKHIMLAVTGEGGTGPAEGGIPRGDSGE